MKLFLQYLLFINPEIGLTPTNSTQSSLIVENQTHVPFMNKVYNHTVPSNQEVIDIITHFKDKPFIWGVDDKDKETIKVLQQASMTYRMSFPIMHLYLKDIKNEKTSSDLTIKTINLNSDHIQDWTNQVALTLHCTPEEIDKELKNIMKKAPHAIKLHQGFYQDVPVSTCMTIQHTPDTISLHWISTKPEYQGKGFGTAITTNALLNAQKNNCKEAILLATEQGKSIYTKLGFQTVSQCHYYSNGSLMSIVKLFINKIYQRFGYPSTIKTF